MGRTFASSDWHGCWEPAKQVLDFLGPDDTLYFLGDAMDRGPDGYKIMKELLSDKRVIYIKGNHEEMMANSLNSFLECQDFDYLWFMNGGDYTWESISNFSDDILRSIAIKLYRLPTNYIYKSPKGHTVILEHAGYSPFDIPHRTHNPLWDREHFYDNWNGGWGQENGENPDTTYLVHGHTPVQYLEFRYGYKGQPQKTKEMMQYGKQWNKYYDCNWIPEVIRYCDEHKFDIDMCTISSGRIALLDLDTFETIYFDNEEIRKGVI